MNHYLMILALLLGSIASANNELFEELVARFSDSSLTMEQKRSFVKQYIADVEAGRMGNEHLGHALQFLALTYQMENKLPQAEKVYLQIIKNYPEDNHLQTEARKNYLNIRSQRLQYMKPRKRKTFLKLLHREKKSLLADLLEQGEWQQSKEVAKSLAVTYRMENMFIECVESLDSFIYAFIEYAGKSNLDDRHKLLIQLLLRDMVSFRVESGCILVAQILAEREEFSKIDIPEKNLAVFLKLGEKPFVNKKIPRLLIPKMRGIDDAKFLSTLPNLLSVRLKVDNV